MSHVHAPSSNVITRFESLFLKVHQSWNCGLQKSVFKGVVRASTLAKAGKLVAKGHGQEARLGSHPLAVMNQQLRVRMRSEIGKRVSHRLMRPSESMEISQVCSEGRVSVCMSGSGSGRCGSRHRQRCDAATTQRWRPRHGHSTQ